MNIEEYTPEKIVDTIKAKEWKHNIDFPIDRFVKKVGKNKYAVDGKYIIQSKPEAIDYDFVQRQVRRAKSGKEFRNDAVCVFFPEDTEIDGKKIEPSTHVKYLGIIIDSHLDWNFHIDELSTNFLVQLECLLRLYTI